MVIHQWIQRAIWTVTCHCRISDKLTWRHQVPAPCMSPPHPLPKRLSNEPLSTSLATNKLSTAKVPGLWSSLAQMRLFLFVWVQKNLQKRSSGPRTLGNLRKFRTILGQGHFDQPPNLETERIQLGPRSWAEPWQAQDVATASCRSQGPWIPWALWASPSHQRSSTQIWDWMGLDLTHHTSNF